METLIKKLSPQILLALLPFLLTKVGTYFIGKDENASGADDAFGNILIAFSPAVAAAQSSNENALKKSLRAAYLTLGNYLGYPPPATES